MTPPTAVVAKVDRWSLRPPIISLLVVGILAMVTGIPGSIGFLLMTVSIFGFPLIGLSLLVVAIVLGVRKCPRRAISLLLALAIPFMLWRPLQWASDYVHLALTAWLDVGYSGPRVKPDTQGFAAYDWSVGLVTNPSTFLIRDDTDRIAASLDPVAKFAKSESDLFQTCAGKSRKLLSHYYICVF